MGGRSSSEDDKEKEKRRTLKYCGVALNSKEPSNHGLSSSSIHITLHSLRIYLSLSESSILLLTLLTTRWHAFIKFVKVRKMQHVHLVRRMLA